MIEIFAWRPTFTTSLWKTYPASSNGPTSAEEAKCDGGHHVSSLTTGVCCEECLLWKYIYSFLSLVREKTSKPPSKKTSKPQSKKQLQPFNDKSVLKATGEQIQLVAKVLMLQAGLAVEICLNKEESCYKCYTVVAHEIWTGVFSMNRNIILVL